MKQVPIDGKTYSVPGEYEPRRLNDDEWDRLLAEVKAAGLAVAVVSEDGDLLAGHHERAAADCCHPPVPVRVVTVAATDRAAKRFLARSLSRWWHRPRDDMREAIRAALRAEPGATNGVIANRVFTLFRRMPSRNTVASIRAQLVSSGEIADLATRVGRDGKPYPAKRKSQPGK